MCFLSSEPPKEVKAKGTQGDVNNKLLGLQSAPNEFKVGLAGACCAEPLCCLGAFFACPTGIPACCARKMVLDTYMNGTEDYVCCQNYMAKACCCCGVPTDSCKGNVVAMCCEGFCCPAFSVSIARLHVMEMKQIRPDPCDWRIIQCSNCLQLLACICKIAACFIKELEYAACIVDIIADVVTCSVTGCMVAQIQAETKEDAKAKAEGKPVAVAGAAQPQVEAMIRQ